MGDITDQMNEILWAEDLASARAAFRSGLAACGIETYAYGNFKLGVDRPYVDSTYPIAWMERYRARGYMAIDPVVRESTRNHLPFAWRYVTNREDGFSDQQRQLFAEAAEFGIRDGYTIPFHGPEGCTALVSFAFESSERMKKVLTAQPNLRLLAVYYHAAVDRLLEDEPGEDMLSGMERQCLEWSLHGRSLWDISAATHRPEQDVATALRAAREKLGAATTAQAARKAVALGLIAAV